MLDSNGWAWWQHLIYVLSVLLTWIIVLRYFYGCGKRKGLKLGRQESHRRVVEVQNIISKRIDDTKGRQSPDAKLFTYRMQVIYSALEILGDYMNPTMPDELLRHLYGTTMKEHEHES